MERVLKRVGLSKRTQSDVEVNMTKLDDHIKFRRRRRSQSRRRSTEEIKKTRGLFNIDWDSVKDCKSCKSKALTRRFCNKKNDNELYRSNSFKFERFIRGNEELSTLGKNISLCEDYSLPVDHLAKKRPNSIAIPPTRNIFCEWNLSSPNEEKVEVLDTYSTPRDSKPNLDPNPEDDQKYLTSPDKEYSQPYTTEASSSPTSDEDFGFSEPYTNRNKKNVLQLNSPDSVNEGGILFQSPNIPSPNKVEVNFKRHPSPYYYGDIYKYKTVEHNSPTKATTNNRERKNQSLRPDREKESKLSERRSKSTRRFRKSSSLDNPSEGREKTTLHARPFLKYKKSSSVETHSSDSRPAPNGTLMPPNPVIINTCADDYGLEDMTRQRHVYETAFDCRISKSDDDLDQIDKVSNHPVLIHVNSDWVNNPVERNRVRENYPSVSVKKDEDNTLLSALSHDIQHMHLLEQDSNKKCTTSTSSALPLRGYTPSPPSTAPLPTKFPGKELMMNSIRSAPNLPTHPKTRLKDRLHLAVQPLRGRSPPISSSGDSLQIHQAGSAFEIEFGTNSESNQLIRTRKDMLLLHHNKRAKDGLLEFKGRRVRHKFNSSTESMTTTSSSGGSMESIKSSTSEGNRSTSSSESRQSPTLSSHSSESGGGKSTKNYTVPEGCVGSFLAQHANKIHILSPISDKSSQEPISETSDNNRNNNSQKCSPEEPPPAIPENSKTKRRPPQNKNLLNLGLGFHTTTNAEIQGSDSGISVQSREGIKSRFGLSSAAQSQQHQAFADLPFDMPKLRRRRVVPEAACTSGSATSVDLRDLPFDMPKLKRRMRLQQPTSSSLDGSVTSQASSSQSVVNDADRQAPCRPKLTLNLGENGRQKLGLTLSGLGLTSNPSSTQPSTSYDGIDINLPLEKQGWFHGSISRIEAENVLRALKEGNFLVRNSESIKQDFSLSLKSARGFMHMRISQNSEDGNFVLGQFSKPFNSIPEMIKHFSVNRLPIRGAEHMCLLQPVIVQLL